MVWDYDAARCELGKGRLGAEDVRILGDPYGSSRRMVLDAFRRLLIAVAEVKGEAVGTIEEQIMRLGFIRPRYVHGCRVWNRCYLAGRNYPDGVEAYYEGRFRDQHQFRVVEGFGIVPNGDQIILSPGETDLSVVFRPV